MDPENDWDFRRLLRAAPWAHEGAVLARGDRTVRLPPHGTLRCPGQMVGELLRRRATGQGQGEAVAVVPTFPRTDGVESVLQPVELVPRPELFVVDSMASFDLPVLFRSARLAVPMANPGRFNGQPEGQGEFRAVVRLDLANREREGLAHLAQEVEAGPLVQTRVQPQDPHAGAVVQGGVLEDLLACQLHDLDVHLYAVTRFVFLKQPDFGATMSLGLLTFGMLFISGMRLRYLASVSAVAIPIIIKLVMEPYRLRRITSFLDPWKDPQGSGFQLIQSFISIGSGGLTGLGLGESKQKLSFLPASHTDFIFCLVGEELGLIGATLVIALFLVLFLRGITVANRSRDSFNYYLAYGLTMMISIQALINFSVVTGMVPTKGLPLPFMSYGGSALLVNMAVIGLLLRISKGDDDVAAEDNSAIIAKKIAKRNIYGSKGYSR